MSTEPQQKAIKQSVIDYIKQELTYDQPDLVLTDELSLIQEQVIDSMGIFRLINFLEDKFDILLEPEELVIDNFSSLQKITDFIMAKKVD